ncbi:MAG: hypothetical protein ACYS22_13105 [Planctomycetota bacterium]
MQAQRGSRAGRGARVVALGLALGFTLGAASLAQAGTHEDSVALGEGEVTIQIEHPDGEELWAQAVALVVKDILPQLEKTTGLSWSSPVQIGFAEDGSKTRGLDALPQDDGTILVRKTGKRKGFRGTAVAVALAKGRIDKVISEPWLAETLAYVTTFNALREAHAVYHEQTFFGEVLSEARGAMGTLKGWAATTVDTPRAMADPDIALAFGYMYLVDRNLGEGVIAGALAKAESLGTVDLKGFINALSDGTGESCETHFIGWAVDTDAFETEEDIPARWKKSDLFDRDKDMLLDSAEADAGTDPQNKDTDGDGRGDGEEVLIDGTDPMKKDRPRKVIIDGDAKEWLRLKKFKAQDIPDDAKDKTVKGGELKATAICRDKDYIYVMIEADAFEGALVSYNIGFDVGSDRVFDYLMTFRATGNKWVADTHGTKDLSWSEYKNDKRLDLAIQDNHAEVRIPRDMLRLPDEFTLLVYTRAKVDGKTIYVDACPREKVNLSRFEH